MEYEDTRYRQAQRPKYDCLVFDLDDTLYPLSSGIAVECRKNIEAYMIEQLGIEESKISDMCDVLYKKYGTTMAGLRAIGHEFDYDHYHSFVHGRLPYERLKTDLALRNLLLSLPLRKVIFTNADRIHAAKVLSRLGLEDCFEGIICFETLNPPKNSSDDNEVGDSEPAQTTESFKNSSDDNEVGDSEPARTTEPFDILQYVSQPNTSLDLPKTPILCKPSTDAIEQALKIAGIDPQRAMFFDDSIRNIQSGKRVGLHTVLVGTSNRTKGVDFALENIHNIREALPELWEGTGKSENVRYSGNDVAIETPVTA